VLRVECAKCGRAGKYRLAHLIAKYGRNEKLFTWTDEITADCPRKLARSDSDPCSAICPDLPKVLSVSERSTDSNQTARQVRNPA
jgi:hypothetical protein